MSFALGGMGCTDSGQTSSTVPTALQGLEDSIPDEPSPPPDNPKFELYSTLTGKMARMEELLNAIDRFIGVPGFESRLVADAEEFQRLLTESRGLYPERLAVNDETRFDETVDQTVTTSQELVLALQANDVEAAREALAELDRQRQNAHTQFSY